MLVITLVFLLILNIGKSSNLHLTLSNSIPSFETLNIIPTTRELNWNFDTDERIFSLFSFNTELDNKVKDQYWVYKPLQYPKINITIYNIHTLDKIREFNVNVKNNSTFERDTEFIPSDILGPNKSITLINHGEPDFRLYIDGIFGFFISKMVKPIDLVNLGIGRRVFLNGFTDKEKIQLTSIDEKDGNLLFEAQLLRYNEVVKTGNVTMSKRIGKKYIDYRINWESLFPDYKDLLNQNKPITYVLSTGVVFNACVLYTSSY
jgi:hypothetical protein